jgi:vacuolar-type H+-ATPase subunit C/Vma6
MHILRLKQFFPKADDYLTALFPSSYKLKPEQIRDMCAAQGPEQVLAVVEGTPYSKIFRNASVKELQNIYDETLFRLSRRQLMMGRSSIYSAVAFLNLRELEMKELITVIETVKYQAKYDDRIAKMLGS